MKTLSQTFEEIFAESEGGSVGEIIEKLISAVKEYNKEVVGGDYLECPPRCTSAEHEAMDIANEEKAEIRKRQEELL